MSDSFVANLRASWLRGAVAKIAFEDVEMPVQENWLPISSAPRDDTPIWSMNSRMKEPIISRRGYAGQKDLWTVIAEPFEKFMPSTGGLHCPDRWQPLSSARP